MKLNCYGVSAFEPSLDVANGGTHTLGTFDKHPHFGGQIAPSGILGRKITKYIIMHVYTYTSGQPYRSGVCVTVFNPQLGLCF